ncbi:MAG: alpha/beta fold hydrolase [Candidatus Eremiobacteraeota bacterium]|nr:alpha/beta fold hydrolase [Candidatus Eremiobacteraeota bacterium]
MKTIVLIHGLWLTPKSWDSFRHHYEAQGYRVLAPAWPGLQGEIEEIRRDPSPIAFLGVKEIADYYERFIKSLDETPILIGHSFGGLIVQMLLDRGLGSAGVAIDSVAPQGVLDLPLPMLKSASPVLSNPFNYLGTVQLTLEQFRYAFANKLNEEEARKVYEEQVIPGPGRPVFQAALANVTPGAVTHVDFANSYRPPLLLIAGSDDHQVPASLNRSNFKKYERSQAVTDFKEFPLRSHLIVSENGWQEVADYALSWAERQLAEESEVGALKVA